MGEKYDGSGKEGSKGEGCSWTEGSGREGRAPPSWEHGAERRGQGGLKRGGGNRMKLGIH